MSCESCGELCLCEPRPSYDEFEFAIQTLRSEYSDAADIEIELRYAKSLASKVVVDYDEGPCGIEFTIDGVPYWYLIGDAQWDSDDPRSDLLRKALADRDSLLSRLAEVERERDEAREELRCYQILGVIDPDEAAREVAAERNAAEAESTRWAPVVEAAKAWRHRECTGQLKFCRETVDDHDRECPFNTTEVALENAIDQAEKGSGT